MGKKWDVLDNIPDNLEDDDVIVTSFDNIHAQQIWHVNWLKEAFRVLKPGALIKAFSGSRTFHRLTAAMEHVGFTNIQIEAWIYGSGFPKSLSIPKALEKKMNNDPDQTLDYGKLAKKFEGYGTCLKPAFEPVIIGRKPISDQDTVRSWPETLLGGCLPEHCQKKEQL